MAAPSKVDYKSIEPEWIAGVKSINQLCTEYFERTGVKVTKASLIKHFNKAQIPRDVKARIIARAEAMVTEREAMVTIKEERLNEMDRKQRNRAVEDATVLNIADRISAERSDVVKARNIVQKMWDKVSAMDDMEAELHTLGEYLRDPSESFDKLNDIYHKVISFPGQVDSIKKLVDSLRNLVLLEREIYGIKVGEGEGNKRHESITIRCVPAPRRDEEEDE